MPVQVVFHPETFGAFFQPLDVKHPGLSTTLGREFTRYMDSNRLTIPSIFGRDAPYVQPPEALSACLMHIHVKIPPARFPRGMPQHDRCCAKGRPGEDAALVYAPGEMEENHFLILAFLWPDAHGKARDRATMKYLARIAKTWRDCN